MNAAVKRRHLWLRGLFYAGLALSAVALWRAPSNWTEWGLVGIGWMAYAAYRRAVEE